MGVRYRKSIKICKGAKVNVSKSGLSLSIGGNGHSVNYGANGRKVTVGIPGSGLSYSTYQKMTDRKTDSSEQERQAVPTGGLLVQMNDKGQISIYDSNGNQITDQTTLRKIKATQQFQAEKERLDNNRKQLIEQMVEESQMENDKFIDIFKLSPSVLDKDAFAAEIKLLSPQQYEKACFVKKEPSEDEIIELLQKEALEVVKGNFLVINKRRKQYVQDNRQVRFDAAKASWLAEKTEFERKEQEKADEFNFTYQSAYEEQKAILHRLLDGEEEQICQVIDEWLASCTLPVEINIEYECNKKQNAIMLDVDLPEIEDLPQTEYVKLSSGNIKEKKKTQTELKQQYAKVVFGMAVFISANFFSFSPAIEYILISGYTQRRNKEGNIVNEYVYSIKFNRKQFERIDLSTIDPVEFCMQAENRCKQTSAGLLQKIVPFEGIDE